MLNVQLLKNSYNSIDDYIRDINAIRLNNKNKWCFIHQNIKINNSFVDISIKFYNTWLQYNYINNINYYGVTGSSVKEFKNTLKRSLNNI